MYYRNSYQIEQSELRIWNIHLDKIKEYAYIDSEIYRHIFIRFLTFIKLESSVLKVIKK